MDRDKVAQVRPHHKSRLVRGELLHERLGGTLLNTILLHDQSLLFLHLKVEMMRPQQISQTSTTFIMIAQLFFDLLNLNCFRDSSKVSSI